MKDNKSLDFTQRVERKLAKYNSSQNIFKRWLFEILSWMASALCMLGIVSIYIYLKQRPLQQAGNLLTLANILGKIASAALILPTSEALGQLKWNWFHKSNAAWDFEIFDKASRGAWGAVMLLFRTKGRSLAALGALVIVLLLAIDTFFQQVVDMPTRWTISKDPSLIPRIVWYEPRSDQILRDGDPLLSEFKDMSVAVEKFMFGNGTPAISLGSGRRPEIPVTCPTSNCTWPRYETLGVCSQCADISDLLEYACLDSINDWTAGLQGGYRPWRVNGTMCGYFLNATSTNPLLMSGSLMNKNKTLNETLIMRILPLTTLYDFFPLYGNGSIRFKDLRNTIADVIIASAANGSVADVHLQKPPVIQECALSWCVKEIRSSYYSGTYIEEVVDTFYNTTAGPWPWQSRPSTVSNGTWVDCTQDINIQRHHDDRSQGSITYGTSRNTTVTMYHEFRDAFPSYKTWNPSTNDTVMRWKTWNIGSAWQRRLDFDPWASPNNVSEHMQRLATAMTNVIRSTPKNIMLHGTSYETETFISIRWEWLTFPFILLLLTLVFLVSTIIKTSRDGAIGVWKTSAMPTLIYSLPKETQSQFTSPSTWNSGKGAPKKTRIKLLPNMGWRVSGQSFPSRLPRLPSEERVPHGWI